MKMSNEKVKFLSVAEVAERLNLTRGRVNQLISDGVLPAERIGRAYMINENDLDKAENRNTQKTGRPPKVKEEKNEIQ